MSCTYKNANLMRENEYARIMNIVNGRDLKDLTRLDMKMIIKITHGNFYTSILHMEHNSKEELLKLVRGCVDKEKFMKVIL